MNIFKEKVRQKIGEMNCVCQFVILINCTVRNALTLMTY